MNRRQKLITNIISMKGGEVSNICCQKLLFYFSQLEIQDGLPPLFEFVPWTKGGYSFTAHFEKDNLAEAGYIVGSKKWHLGDYVELPSLGWSDSARLHRVMEEVGDLDDDDLMRWMYVRYPEYAIRSSEASRLLLDMQDVLEEIQQQKDIVEHAYDDAANLFTIGYEGLTIEEFFARLQRDKIEMLIDVRKVPFSHKMGFSKAKLEVLCEGFHIRYKHFPELGIPSSMRKELNTQADYDSLFEEYQRSILPQQEALLQKIAAMVDRGQRIALMCFEADPMQCHRRIVAEKLAEISGKPYHNLLHRALPTCLTQASLAF